MGLPFQQPTPLTLARPVLGNVHPPRSQGALTQALPSSEVRKPQILILLKKTVDAAYTPAAPWDQAEAAWEGFCLKSHSCPEGWGRVKQVT